MTIYQLRKEAEEAGVPLNIAMEQRRQNLYNTMIEWDAYVTSQDALEIPDLDLNQIVDELIALRLALKQLEQPPNNNDITPEMIERARQTPITDIVKFYRGKIKCFNHEDKNPSAFCGTKTNQLICPVCGKSWNPIDVLMQRDGLEFPEAVKELLCR